MQINFKLGALGILAFLLIGLSACNNDSIDDLPDSNTRIVWTGPTVSFEKIEGTDPNDAANQDRITDNVWITRSNDGEQIFNIRTESGSSKADSPAGTQWAVGTIDNIDNLTFSKFRDAVGKPKNVVGKDLVAFLVEDNVFISVKFTKWSQSKAGGFAYERSSE